jgi:mycofactocin system glycosyltransferase
MCSPVARTLCVMASFTRDTQWFRMSDGLGVVAGSPLTQFRVTRAGAVILDALENDTPLPQGHEPLTSRLLAKGAIHPIHPLPLRSKDITVVIPTYITTTEQLARLQRLVTQLQDIAVVVVDDASPQPVDIDNAIVVRHKSNTGPGAARNTGLTHVHTTYVAFVDDDVSVTTESLLILGGFLSHRDTHLVAPRVMSANINGSLADYERYHSPLDLGNTPAVVLPTSRVSYVPTAVLVARVETLRALDGFDESLRTGEDVDLIWRAIDNNFTVRYIPSVTASHLPRTQIKNFLRQRFGYGRSAAGLDSRHPQLAAPLRTHLLLLAAPVLALTGFVLPFIASLVVAYLWFLYSLRSTQLGLRERLRVISIGQWATTRLLVRAVSRPWWPFFAILSGFSNRILLMFSLCVLVPPLVELIVKRPRYPSSFVVFSILDNFSYGLGLWAGAIRQKSARCLLPVLTVSSRRLRSQG